MYIKLVNLLKGKRDTIIFKIFINFLLLFIFSFIYYHHRTDYEMGENKIDNHGDAIYFSLIIHTGLGFGDIIPNFKVDNHMGRNIVMIHLFFVVISLCI